MCNSTIFKTDENELSAKDNSYLSNTSFSLYYSIYEVLEVGIDIRSESIYHEFVKDNFSYPNFTSFGILGHHAG